MHLKRRLLLHLSKTLLNMANTHHGRGECATRSHGNAHSTTKQEKLDRILCHADAARVVRLEQLGRHVTTVTSIANALRIRRWADHKSLACNFEIHGRADRRWHRKA